MVLVYARKTVGEKFATPIPPAPCRALRHCWLTKRGHKREEGEARENGCEKNDRDRAEKLIKREEFGGWWRRGR